jgi:hypothetical protein
VLGDASLAWKYQKRSRLNIDFMSVFDLYTVGDIKFQKACIPSGAEIDDIKRALNNAVFGHCHHRAAQWEQMETS